MRFVCAHLPTPNLYAALAEGRQRLNVSNERREQLTSKNLQGAPDLVVEILSPGTRARDLRLKRAVYERTGVMEYWAIDPDRDVVDVFRLTAAGTFGDPIRLSQTDRLMTPLLSGLELPLDKLFA